MKFRLDFVTNSSSSSYVCDICGHIESGWDVSLSDAEMSECELGHIFCKDHIDTIYTSLKSDLIAYFNKKNTENKVSYELEQVLALLDFFIEIHKMPYPNPILFGPQMLKLYDIFCEGVEELSGFTSKKSCPLCSMQTITDWDLLHYLLIKDNHTKQHLIKCLQDEYNKDYNAFKSFRINNFTGDGSSSKLD